MHDDDLFIRQFEERTFPFDEWHHRAHVKLAYLYAARFGREIAAQKLRDGIRAYNAANNVPDAPTRGYHETMTQAWLRIIHATMEQYGPCGTADEFFDLHPQLSQKKILRLFYSPALFMSPRAKQEFVEPDLTAFPRPVPQSLLNPVAPAHHADQPKQSLGLVSLLVRDYEEALAFFVGTLGFVLVEDTVVPEQAKRWVVVAPPRASESRLLLARASAPEQESRIGAQTGGRVFLFLYTDDFWRDYKSFTAKGVVFVREPREEPYGIVAVFKDLYGNLWDLLQPRGIVRSPP